MSLATGPIDSNPIITGLCYIMGVGLSGIGLMGVVNPQGASAGCGLIKPSPQLMTLFPTLSQRNLAVGIMIGLLTYLGRPQRTALAIVLLSYATVGLTDIWTLLGLPSGEANKVGVHAFNAGVFVVVGARLAGWW